MKESRSLGALGALTIREALTSEANTSGFVPLGFGTPSVTLSTQYQRQKSGDKKNRKSVWTNTDDQI